MMKINTRFFPMLEIAVIGIIDVLLYVAIILRKTTQVIGRHARNVEKLLKQKCTFIMAQMNIILQNCRIRRIMSQPSVQNAEKQ